MAGVTIEFTSRNGEVRRLFEDFKHSTLHQRGQSSSRNVERLQRLHPSSAASGGQRINQLSLIFVQLAFIGLKHRDLDRAPGVLHGRYIFPRQPLLPHHPSQDQP